MAQHDYIIDDADGASVLADLNALFAAVATTNKGSSRPATINAGQCWIDDNTPSATVWSLYLYDGTTDILLMTVDTVNHIATPGGATTKAIQQAAVDVARYVNASQQVHHPSAAKLHGSFYSDSGGAHFSADSYNVSSIVRAVPGIFTINLNGGFTSSSWSFIATGGFNSTSTNFLTASILSKTANSVTIALNNAAGVHQDVLDCGFAGYGTLA